MKNLIIMPQAQNRNRFGFNAYVEDATIIEEPINTVRPKRFIEANTEEVTLQHLMNDCITPVFSKDNELTINHAQFIETIQDAVQSFFNGEQVEQADIRVSHMIKGRIIDIPTIYETVGGNRLNLSVVGVRAYNQMNLYSKKSPELFRLAIGFKNQVCCNMCVFTDGYKDDLRVSSTNELYRSALELFNGYNAAKHIHLMQSLGDTYMSEHQFCQIIGRMRLYQCLPTGYQKALPRHR